MWQHATNESTYIIVLGDNYISRCLRGRDHDDVANISRLSRFIIGVVVVNCLELSWSNYAKKG